MLLIKRIIVIMCAKNYKKNKFKFVEVIQEKVFETEDTELIIKFLQ